eukprot:1002052-Amphidinium_carterae.1
MSERSIKHHKNSNKLPTNALAPERQVSMFEGVTMGLNFLTTKSDIMMRQKHPQVELLNLSAKEQ